MHNGLGLRLDAQAKNLAQIKRNTIWKADDRAHSGRLVRILKIGPHSVRFEAHRSWCRAQRNRVWSQSIDSFLATHRPHQEAVRP
jgi:hypothetical protein